MDASSDDELMDLASRLHGAKITRAEAHKMRMTFMVFILFILICFLRY